MDIFILAKADYQNYGLGTQKVYVFRDKRSATEVMRKQYLDACKEYGISDPYKQGHGYEFSETYAYLEQYVYWDIFRKRIPE